MSEIWKEIQGDFSGTQKYEGNIRIRGNVLSGSRLEISSGNIEITGWVENSQIKTDHGWIKVAGEIRGIQSQIISGGSITAASVHLSRLKAREDIILKEKASAAQMICRKYFIMNKGQGHLQ